MLKFNYFNGHYSQGFVALFTGRSLQLVGYSLLGLFLPVYLYIKFDWRVDLVIFFFIANSLLYIIFMPWGAQALNMIGLRRSLRISVLLFASYFLCLMLLDVNFSVFLTLALVFVTLGKMFFWLPFNTDLAKFTDNTNRGKSLSLLAAVFIFLGVAMPIISGFLISHFGYDIVFILAIAFYISSIIPYLTLPSTHEKFSWTYWETIKKFFAQKNRKLVLSNMANGAENDAAIIIWPIIIWQIMKGDYLAVGVLSSLIVLAAVIMQLLVGNYVDIFNKRRMMHWGSLLYAIGWLAKVFVFSPVQIFFAGTYHNFTQIFKDTPFETLNYELMADKGHFVDEYTVLREMAVWSGKLLFLLAALLVAENFGLNWTFALAAIASLLVNLF